MNTHVIVALDTADLDEAKDTVTRLNKYVFAFKIGHALVFKQGLEVVSMLRDAGAQRVFLDMKFHDIPNSVALGVYEATKRGVWMMTLHCSGGRAMMMAAVEAAQDAEPDIPPVLLGVTVLTSIDDNVLKHEIGVSRTTSEHALYLAHIAMNSGLDGVVCSGHEVRLMRKELGPEAVLVTPGIRSPAGDTDDQKRVVTARTALDEGANYVVIGRALTQADEPENALSELGL